MSGGRMTGFDPVPVDRALAWVDAATDCLGAEQIALTDAAGRILAADVRAANPIPAVDCAATDGFALGAAASFGAGAYNPLAVSAVAVRAGEPMPPMTDAVAPAEFVEIDDAGRIAVVEPIAVGANVDRCGAVADTGALLVAAGTRLRPRHLGLLALAGCVCVAVTRRPRVRLVIAGSARCGPALDSNGAMLRALVEDDGGTATATGLADAFAPGADIVVVAGGTGRGANDHSAAALAAAGTLDLRGVALVPGDTAGFGRTAGGEPVILLPGSPAACLWNYELFAGRAIRRLAGCSSKPRYRRERVVTARKIVSAIGMTEICPVRRLDKGHIEPVASFAEGGLGAAVAADGFVIVPAPSEGFPAGAAIEAYFYEAC
jgi:molybdopterin molybdotransferase